MLDNGSLKLLAPQPRASAPTLTLSPLSVGDLSGSRKPSDDAVERARQEVILPHEQLRKLGLAKPIFGQAQVPTESSNAAQGSIHYVRDSDSEHDSDEDPDDDLDM